MVAVHGASLPGVVAGCSGDSPRVTRTYIGTQGIGRTECHAPRAGAHATDATSWHPARTTHGRHGRGRHDAPHSRPTGRPSSLASSPVTPAASSPTPTAGTRDTASPAAPAGVPRSTTSATPATTHPATSAACAPHAIDAAPKHNPPRHAPTSRTPVCTHTCDHTPPGGDPHPPKKSL